MTNLARDKSYLTSLVQLVLLSSLQALSYYTSHILDSYIKQAHIAPLPTNPYCAKVTWLKPIEQLSRTVLLVTLLLYYS
jgi:hypothetical protein